MWSQLPGLFARIIAAIVKPRKASRESRRGAAPAVSGGVDSRIRDLRGDRLLRARLLELLQEPHIILNEVPDVRDSIFPHRDALDAESERPAAVFFRIDLARLEHVGVNHPAAA